MKQYAFTFFLISGFYTLWPCLAHQYHLVEDEKSWSDAQSFCRQNYVDLASLLHQGQGALLPQSSRDAWIGLRRAWQWSLAHPDLYEDAEDSSLIWREGKPNNYDGYENCAEMRGDGTLNDAICSYPLYFICFKESQTPEYFPISHQKVNWTEAQRYCKDQNYTGLAVIKKAEDRKRIQDKLVKWSPDESWWIGLSKIWMWSDQSQFSYHNWNNTSTEGKDPICTAVGSTGKWQKEECSEKKPFYCYDDDLILVKENRTWDEALDYCRRHHSDRVSVYTESLQHWVKKRAQQASTDHVWLGLTCISKYWYRVNADGVCHQNWASQNLQDKCGHMGAIETCGGQKWYKLPKTERINFICGK